MLKIVKISVNILCVTIIFSAGCNNFQKEVVDNKKESDRIITVTKDEEPYFIQRENKEQRIINRLDSINESLKWKKLQCGLYINKRGEIALQIPFSTGIGRTVNYLDHVENTKNKGLLKNLIDTLSFRRIGSTFYKDKNYIYHYYDMAYGGRFYIYNIADHKTFRVLGDHYAKDKHHIYGERAGILKHVDYTTFTSQKGVGPYAKDKFGYYFWDELLITHKQLKNQYNVSNLSLKEFADWNSDYAKFN